MFSTSTEPHAQLLCVFDSKFLRVSESKEKPEKQQYTKLLTTRKLGSDAESFCTADADTVVLRICIEVL